MSQLTVEDLLEEMNKRVQSSARYRIKAPARYDC